MTASSSSLVSQDAVAPIPHELAADTSLGSSSSTVRAMSPAKLQENVQKQAILAFCSDFNRCIQYSKALPDSLILDPEKVRRSEVINAGHLHPLAFNQRVSRLYLLYQFAQTLNQTWPYENEADRAKNAAVINKVLSELLKKHPFLKLDEVAQIETPVAYFYHLHALYNETIEKHKKKLAFNAQGVSIISYDDITESKIVSLALKLSDEEISAEYMIEMMHLAQEIDGTKGVFVIDYFEYEPGFVANSLNFFINQFLALLDKMKSHAIGEKHSDMLHKVLAHKLDDFLKVTPIKEDRHGHSLKRNLKDVMLLCEVVLYSHALDTRTLSTILSFFSTVMSRHAFNVYEKREIIIVTDNILSRLAREGNVDEDIKDCWAFLKLCMTSESNIDEMLASIVQLTGLLKVESSKNRKTTKDLLNKEIEKLFEEINALNKGIYDEFIFKIVDKIVLKINQLKDCFEFISKNNIFKIRLIAINMLGLEMIPKKNSEKHLKDTCFDMFVYASSFLDADALGDSTWLRIMCLYLKEDTWHSGNQSKQISIYQMLIEACIVGRLDPTLFEKTRSNLQLFIETYGDGFATPAHEHLNALAMYIIDSVGRNEAETVASHEPRIAIFNDVRALAVGFTTHQDAGDACQAFSLLLKKTKSYPSLMVNLYHIFRQRIAITPSPYYTLMITAIEEVVHHVLYTRALRDEHRFTILYKIMDVLARMVVANENDRDDILARVDDLLSTLRSIKGKEKAVFLQVHELFIKPIELQANELKARVKQQKSQLAKASFHAARTVAASSDTVPTSDTSSVDTSVAVAMPQVQVVPAPQPLVFIVKPSTPPPPSSSPAPLPTRSSPTHVSATQKKSTKRPRRGEGKKARKSHQSLADMSSNSVPISPAVPAVEAVKDAIEAPSSGVHQDAITQVKTEAPKKPPAIEVLLQQSRGLPPVKGSPNKRKAKGSAFFTDIPAAPASSSTEISQPSMSAAVDVNHGESQVDTQTEPQAEKTQVTEAKQILPSQAPVLFSHKQVVQRQQLLKHYDAAKIALAQSHNLTTLFRVRQAGINVTRTYAFNDSWTSLDKLDHYRELNVYAATYIKALQSEATSITQLYHRRQYIQHRMDFLAHQMSMMHHVMNTEQQLFPQPVMTEEKTSSSHTELVSPVEPAKQAMSATRDAQAMYRQTLLDEYNVLTASKVELEQQYQAKVELFSSVPGGQEASMTGNFSALIAHAMQVATDLQRERDRLVDLTTTRCEIRK